VAGAEGVAGLGQGMEMDLSAQSLCLYVTYLVTDRVVWVDGEHGKTIRNLSISPYGFFGALCGPHVCTPSLKDPAVAFQASALLPRQLLAARKRRVRSFFRNKPCVGKAALSPFRAFLPSPWGRMKLASQENNT